MENNKEIRMKELQKKLESIKAEDIMTTEIVTASEELPLSEISDFMIKKRISGLPVVREKGELVGMITATDLFTMIDIIRSGDIKEEALNPKVNFAMSTNIVSITRDTRLDQIITIMKKNNIHTIPVCEEGKMVGVIGRRDVFKNFYSAAGNVAAG